MYKKSLFSIITLCLVAIMFCLNSCVKNYYYECDTQGSSSSGTTTNKSYLVKFSALVNKVTSATRTSSVTPLQQNRFVTVYSF